MHAGDSVSVIERLVAVFPAEEQSGVRRQLALILRAIVSQHLLRADGPKESGSRRRVVVSEVLRATPAVANLVASGKSAQLYSTLELGAAQGMQTLEQDLARLLHAGTIQRSTAELLARDSKTLDERVRLLRSGGVRPRRRAGR